MRSIGLDVHKQLIQAAMVDEQGELLQRCRLECSREALEAFGRHELRADDQVALEATTNCWWVLDLLQPFVARIVVSNPLRTKAIAQAKIKTDKVDALVLAQLLRCQYLPEVWVPDSGTRLMRQLVSHRAALVSDRTAVKNRIHSLLHLRLIAPPAPDLFSNKGLQWLQQVPLDELGRFALDSELRLLAAIESEIEAAQHRIALAGYRDARVKLLMTLPGVDVSVAHTLLSALGDIERFRDADHAAGYLGLVPSTRQSAEHCYHGRITKQGNSHARWMLVQAAQHLSSHPGPLGVFFRRLLKKKNRNVAVVATARKLVTIAWHMLKNNEPYRYALPQATQSKLSRLRVEATGQRRKSGLGKGCARPAAYGTGNPTRAVPSLDDLYNSEALPALQQPRPGEQRMLREQGIQTFSDSLHRGRRVPKKTKPKARAVRSQEAHAAGPVAPPSAGPSTSSPGQTVPPVPTGSDFS
jgi:transposase